MVNELIWLGKQFVLTDPSGSGNLGYVGNHNKAVMLRGAKRYLLGNNAVVPGSNRVTEAAPVIISPPKAEVQTRFLGLTCFLGL